MGSATDRNWNEGAPSNGLIERYAFVDILRSKGPGGVKTGLIDVCQSNSAAQLSAVQICRFAD